MIEMIGRLRRRRTAVAAVASVIALGLAIAAWQRLAGGVGVPREQWQTVSQEPVEWRIGLVGRIGPAALLAVSAPFEGNVQAVLVGEGQTVQAGQLLIEMDTTDVDMRLREAKAELLKAQAAVQNLRGWEQGVETSRSRRALANARMNLADTNRKLADTRALFQRGIVPRMEVDALEQQSRAQQLEVSSAQAELTSTLARGEGESREIAGMELANAQARYDAVYGLKSRARLTAPYAGIVLRAPAGAPGVSAAPLLAGSRVSQGQALLRVAGTERLQAIAKVDEADINALQAGMPVRVTGDGFPGLVLQGRVEAVGALLAEEDAQAGPPAYEVVVGITPPTQSQRDRLRLGMSARLDILNDRNDCAIVVPAAAVRGDEEGRYVIARPGPGQPRSRVPVVVGRATEKGVEVTGVGQGEVLLAGNDGV